MASGTSASGQDQEPACDASEFLAWTTWRVHREAQHGAGGHYALVRALAELYAHTYSVDPDDVRLAASLRADAIVVSDAWVAAGCDVADPRLAEERALLVRSFAALLAAVHRP